MELTQPAALEAAPEWNQLTGVLGCAADFAWEQDRDQRIVRFAGVWHDERASPQGRCWAELGFELADACAGPWSAGRAFRGLVLRSAGGVRFLRLSGMPFFDARGECAGFRGVGEDVTASEAERQRLREFQEAVSHCPEPLFVCDTEALRFTFASESASVLTGIPREDLLRHVGPHHLTQKTKPETAEIFTQAQAAEGVRTPPHLSVSRDGTRKGWWAPHHRTVTIGGRRVTVTVSREVSDTVLAQEAARRAQRMFSALSATNEAILHARTPEALFQQVCDAAVAWGGFASASVLLLEPGRSGMRAAAVAGIGQQRMRHAAGVIGPAADDPHGLTTEAIHTRVPCVSNDFLNDPRTSPWHASAQEISLKSAAALPILSDDAAIGVLFLCSADKRAFDDESVALLQRMAQNIAFALAHQQHERERLQAEARIRHMATHDSLTRLPNRVLFGEQLNEALHAAEEQRRGLALLFIDLDRFKWVNDTLGHEAGDELLKTVAARLRSAIRATDVLARMGGDEFVVLLRDVRNEADAAAVARGLLAAAIEPLTLRDCECQVSASIGISLYPHHGSDDRSLLTAADAAMYRAKGLGKNNFQFYAPEACA